jgi:transcriptional regulator with XRE-family HTH domain
MPRPERPLDPSGGPVQRFAGGLRELRRRAGTPGYRELALRAGYSATTLSDAAGGRRLPMLPVVLAYVRACGDEPAGWGARWRAVAEELAAARDGRAAASDDPPYRGLASYRPEDAARFFGRERLVEELLHRTQEELAGRARLAVRTIRYLERGQRRPLPSTVRLLSEALGVDGAALARLHATARGQQRARRSGGGIPRAATRRTPLRWAAAVLAGAAQRLR